MRRIGMALAAALLALSTLAPAVSAEDEWPPPNWVAPCFGFDGWIAEPDQPIHFLCGWGAVGGPGKLVSFLNSYSATLTVRDEQGAIVLRIDPDELATLWADPVVGPAEDDVSACAGPTSRAVMWHYWLDGLPAGIYEVTFSETLGHPVNDGYHTCWWDDGARVVPPPSLYRGSWESVNTLTVAPL